MIRIPIWEGLIYSFAVLIFGSVAVNNVWLTFVSKPLHLNTPSWWWSVIVFCIGILLLNKMWYKTDTVKINMMDEEIKKRRDTMTMICNRKATWVRIGFLFGVDMIFYSLQ